jgi:hypothetical protein
VKSKKIPPDIFEVNKAILALEGAHPHRREPEEMNQPGWFVALHLSG